MFENDDTLKKYSDIIDMPHHVSTKHQHMSAEERAAQFSPFAALTGHEDAIKETARITEEFVELDADKKQEIDVKLQLLRKAVSENEDARAHITYFEPDDKKSGGSYESVTGKIKKIDENSGFIMFDDKTAIKIERIIDIDNVL